jgi:hypothetical protein
VVRRGFIDIYLNRYVPPFCRTLFRLSISENVAVLQGHFISMPKMAERTLLTPRTFSKAVSYSTIP